MIDSLTRWFSTDGFMPHGMCYLWRPGILSLHVLSDSLIASAYATIPFTLVYFVRKRKDLEFSWMFVCFAIFIVACGTTHLMEIWVIWHPNYWLSGSIKAITAMASVPTAILLVRLLPDALSLPSAAMLREANLEMNRQMQERERAEQEIRRMNGELEARVAARTRELEAANQSLQQEVAERKRAESQLRLRTEELARSNGELEQFAYSASHDLQEPLRAVAGFMQLFRKRYGGQLDARADEYIDQSVDGAKRMQQLIDDLLEYSRVGRGSNNNSRVDCNEALNRAKTNLGAAIQESGAIIEQGQLPSVTGDRTRLAQVFQNLIGNAIKFRRELPPRIKISCRQKDDQYVFAVSDNGIGIEARHFDRIFGVFQRLHSRVDYPGTGIGLAVCAKIVAAHRGRMWLESEPGVGSTFYFALPVSVEGQK